MELSFNYWNKCRFWIGGGDAGVVMLKVPLQLRFGHSLDRLQNKRKVYEENVGHAGHVLKGE
jgi:hypothetical protein